ncbi:hypothetical protein [Salinarimonas ramus]|uniref:Uncharacterized protein n=1 Tax=Salinarimonas ramus TaxID=690164 RepID=A0A917V3B5_9HYPH|nr:hypothetical protein [Salinarimonas ramus]GGK29013.1 hypothetical protein GCM10011322_14290 [Salinarimonas ramus]
MTMRDFVTTRLGLIAVAIASVTGPQAALASQEAILALERLEIGEFCAETSFLDGYATPVDANGDDRPDYVVNTQLLLCDGSQMMFCGSAGCTHRVWVQRSDGGYDLAYDGLVYEITFDRPDEPSFLARGRGGDTRVRLASVGPTAPQPDAAPGAHGPFSSERWTYHPDPVPHAGVADLEGGALWLACESGSIRVRYTAQWMFEDGAISDFVREWDRDYGLVPTFAAVGREIDLPSSVDERANAVAADELVDPAGPLVEILARGDFVTVYHGGSLEHELQYPLRGSSAALASLRAACG